MPPLHNVMDLHKQPACCFFLGKILISVSISRPKGNLSCKMVGWTCYTTFWNTRVSAIRQRYQFAFLSNKGLVFNLRIKKIHTAAYHPQCDGMVERFNCTLKTMQYVHAVPCLLIAGLSHLWSAICLLQIQVKWRLWIYQYYNCSQKSKETSIRKNL